MAILDDRGGPPGDHDQPFAFGHHPTAAAPFPFTPGQYARLLGLRTRVRDVPGLRLFGDTEPDDPPLTPDPPPAPDVDWSPYE